MRISALRLGTFFYSALGSKVFTQQQHRIKIGYKYISSTMADTNSNSGVLGETKDGEELESKYEKWSKESLIARIRELESLHLTSSSITATIDGYSAREVRTKFKPEKTISPSRNRQKTRHLTRRLLASTSANPTPDRVNRRKIALKFIYLGTPHSGLAYQSPAPPIPTVEEVLFKALVKTRLVAPHGKNGEGGFEECGWSRCGRTDKGVSAAGQVVSLWVRSGGKMGGEEIQVPEEDAVIEEEEEGVGVGDTKGDTDTIDDDLPLPPFDIADYSPNLVSSNLLHPKKPPSFPQPRELNYPEILNHVLPPTIRIIAWSPVAPTFDARFDCRRGS